MTCGRRSRRLQKAGPLLGIVSNFEAWLEDWFGVHELIETFPVRVISGIEGIEKPDERIYRLALERAGVDAAESAYVGDNPEFDVDPPAGARDVRRARRSARPVPRPCRGPRTDLRELPAMLERRVTEERLFTLDEANAELDELRARLPRLREARQRMIDTSERITSAVGLDGGGVEGSDWFRAHESLKVELLWLAERGILLRDPETGFDRLPGRARRAARLPVLAAGRRPSGLVPRRRDRVLRPATSLSRER